MPETVPTERHPKPHSILLGEWAIAGGGIGYPVHLCFNGFPAPIMAEVFRRFIGWLGSDCVLTVHGQRDIQTLREKLDSIRLVLLFDEKLYPTIAWLLETTLIESDADRRPSPVVFLLGSGPLDETPGPLLTIHGSSPELKSVAAWIEAQLELSNCPPSDMTATVSLDEQRNVVLWQASKAHSSVRFKQILRGLLLGAACSKCPEAGHAAVPITKEVYESVHRVLTSSRTQSADECFNPLTLFMTQRANAYLAMKRDHLEQTKLVEDIHLNSEGLITRREVVDLGNTTGKTTLNLVDFLLKDDQKGFKKFHSCGLTISIDSATGEWPSRDAKVCRNLLLRWSPKQVRTHFHRLVGEGLISAIRKSDNQPWKYRLPESLSEVASPFRKLPTADVLSFPLGSIEWSAPDCPPAAHDNGQTEVFE